MSVRPVFPPPKQRLPQEGVWRPLSATQILLPPGHDHHLRRDARVVREAFMRRGQRDIPIAARSDLDAAARPIILLLEMDGEQWAPQRTANLPPPQSEEGYVLDISPDRIVIVGGGPAGLFYGVQTLRQLILRSGAVHAERILDWPTLPLRGVMIDVARGKVPTMNTFRTVIELLARSKANVFQLYNEHAFAWQKHPKIGAGHSPLTPSELLELDSYCSDRHIEFIPTLNALGHNEVILSLPQYKHLDESGKRWTLSPANPGTYDLLEDLLAEYLPNFRSNFVNLSCDEPWDLGEGQSAKLAREKGVIGVYVDHVLRLREMAARHGKQMMIWGDMLIEHPESLRHLPKDIVVLDWWYEAEHNFDRVEAYRAAGQPFLVCPGTGSWNSFTARLPTAIANMDGYANAATRYGASGLLCTDWGDNGHMNMVGTIWYATSYACSTAWGAQAVERDAFDQAFSSFSFHDAKGVTAKAYRALGDIHFADGMTAFNGSPYFYMLFNETLESGTFADSFTDARRRTVVRVLTQAERALERARDPLSRGDGTYREMAWGLAMSRHAVDHIVLIRRERAAWNGHPTTTPGQRRKEARRLKQRLNALQKQFRELWLERNRPDGYEFRTVPQFNKAYAIYDAIIDAERDGR